MKEIIFGATTPTSTNNTVIAPSTERTTTGLQTVTEETTDLQGNIVSILNGVIGVLSFVAVVVIIIGGVTYMTSSGDTNKVKKAKDTILYGVIGLAVCVLAFAIVNFVITQIIGSGQ